MRKLWNFIKYGNGNSEPSTIRAGLWIFAGGYLFYLAYSVLKELISQAPDAGELALKIFFVLLFVLVGIFFILVGFFTMKRSLAKASEEITDTESSVEEQEKKIEESASDSEDK